MKKVLELAEIEKLKKEISRTQLPQDLKVSANSLVERLSVTMRFGSFSQEYQTVASYIDWITHLPWEVKSQGQLDLTEAKKILDKYHYGLSDIKERVLEYMAVMKLRAKTGQSARAPILCLVGLVGTGKTTLARSIAEAMGRKLIRIPFGGIERAFYLRGRSRAFPQAEPGQIVKGLRRVQTLNPVILLDEIDRIAKDAKSAVMGVLVELLDPEQNDHFVDYFVDYPIDLSQAFFIATCNNTRGISQAVLDRLEVITMPSYTDEEKITIAKQYLLPQALEKAGLKPENLVIAPSVWPKIVRPLGYDAGVRTLGRNIVDICRQVAKEIVTGSKNHFVINEENLASYLKSW